MSRVMKFFSERLSRCWRSVLTATVIGSASLILLVGASQAQTVSTVADFSPSVGCDSWYTLVAQGRDGNLYTTSRLCDTNNNGSVVQVTPDGVLTVLYNFDGIHGSNPNGGLTLGSDGNFYGTTWGGGSAGAGTIFKVTSNGTLTVLYNFPGGTGLGQPIAAPMQASDGNFYGTTTSGGTSGLCGVVYKMTPSGTVSTVHNFEFADGCRPFAVLIEGSDGLLYGTTAGDSYPNQYELGNAFKINVKTGQLTVLYSFDGTHGTRPTAALIEGSDGNFYGTASGGGIALGRPLNHGGVLFKLTPSGSLTVFHNFNPDQSSGDGWGPYGGLIQATDGRFYGPTWAGGGPLGGGSLFSLDLNGDYSLFYSFDGSAGAIPTSPMMQHTNGNLYGVSSAGGTTSSGTLYSLSYGMGPFVAFVQPSGKVGKTAQILGQGLTGTTSVTFNGVAATTFTVVSDTYMTAVVPNGATTGPVVVETPSGTLTSNKNFRITN